MTRSMRRRFRKMVLASTLAVLGATGPGGWWSSSTFGQEAPISAQAHGRPRKTSADVKAAYSAMMAPLEDREAKAATARILATEIESREARIRALEAKLAETTHRNSMEQQVARVRARTNELKVQENARRLEKIAQYNADREIRDQAARDKEDARQAQLKADYDKHNRNIAAQNAAQRASYYAHRPIYGPLIAAPGIPEFTSLKGMVDRLRYYEQELRLVSGNGYLVRDLARQMNAKLNACVGHEVTWEFKVLQIDPNNCNSRNDYRRVGTIVVEPVGSDGVTLGMGPGASYPSWGWHTDRDALEIGANITAEFAKTLIAGDVILVKGTIIVCEMNVDSEVHMYLNKAQMNSPLICGGYAFMDSTTATIVKKVSP